MVIAVFCGQVQVLVAGGKAVLFPVFCTAHSMKKAEWVMCSQCFKTGIRSQYFKTGIYFLMFCLG